MHSPAVAQLASHTGEWDQQILLYYEYHVEMNIQPVMRVVG